MNTLASRNPDTKIKATAALDNSQKRSIKLESNNELYNNSNKNGNETTIDLKSCSVYAHKGKSLI